MRSVRLLQCVRAAAVNANKQYLSLLGTEGGKLYNKKKQEQGKSILRHLQKKVFGIKSK